MFFCNTEVRLLVSTCSSLIYHFSYLSSQMLPSDDLPECLLAMFEQAAQSDLDQHHHQINSNTTTTATLTTNNTASSSSSDPQDLSDNPHSHSNVDDSEPADEEADDEQTDNSHLHHSGRHHSPTRQSSGQLLFFFFFLVFRSFPVFFHSFSSLEQMAK
jgi:hypothetical protein